MQAGLAGVATLKRPLQWPRPPTHALGVWALPSDWLLTNKTKQMEYLLYSVSLGTSGLAHLIK